MESDSATSGTDDAFVVRWVFPRPALEPTWLVEPKTTFGRDASSDVVLESGYVSRRHAAITRSGPLFVAADQSSKNGIVRNGRAVRQTPLEPGDVVRFGNYVGVCLRAPLGADLSLRTLAPGIFGGRMLARAYERLLELAPTDLAVVLVGESGTGKERFARALHDASARSGPFRAVNCSVYSKSMAAAELFGYRKGAFTGAEGASIGHVRAAEAGTLLLDEIVELAPDVQAMLLRVLENREVLPLGEARPVQVDVRFVSAAQSRLGELLRPDLRARLEGGVIALPPLRECREVVVEMFLSLFEKHAGYRPELRTASAELLCLHDWPLNVRELDTVARRIAAKGGDGAIDGETLEQALGVPMQGVRGAGGGLPETLERRKRAPAPYRPEDIESLVGALARNHGNLTKAAAELGLPRTRAYRMLRTMRATKPKSG